VTETSVGEFDAPQALDAAGEWEPPTDLSARIPNSHPTREVGSPGWDRTADTTPREP
jgi:hypothetical protein